MDLAKFQEMTQRLVIDPMMEFIIEEDDDCNDYTPEDVQKCQSLIDAYLNALNNLAVINNEAIMAQVQRVVFALNDLNEATDYTLIETEAREALWEVIQTSAVACGLTDAPDDITEEWREW